MHRALWRSQYRLPQLLGAYAKYRPLSRFSSSESKEGAAADETVLYEDLKTPDGGMYRVHSEGQEGFTSEDWDKFEHAFGLKVSKSEEEIDAWVKQNVTESTEDTPLEKPEADEQVDTKQNEEYDAPVKSVRELRKLGKLPQSAKKKKNMHTRRALRSGAEMEKAVVRALNGGHLDSGIEVCEAILSENMKTLTVLYRSDEQVEAGTQNYKEMEKMVKSEIARSVRNRFVPKVRFRNVTEYDEKNNQVEGAFKQIAEERKRYG